jgi:histidine phosphotransferase ChpT
MSKPTAMTALLGSRICHDLISPLGAIGNGVELLMMSGVNGPELALIQESVANANARIKFFRVAFGAVSEGTQLKQSEIEDILTPITRGGRQKIDWQVTGGAQRAEIKLAFLCLQCLETAMPYGGKITVRCEGLRWKIEAEASKFREIPKLWAAFRSLAEADQLTASEIQFALAPICAFDIGRTLEVRETMGLLSIRF